MSRRNHASHGRPAATDRSPERRSLSSSDGSYSASSQSSPDARKSHRRRHHSRRSRRSRSFSESSETSVTSSSEGSYSDGTTDSSLESPAPRQRKQGRSSNGRGPSASFRSQIRPTSLPKHESLHVNVQVDDAAALPPPLPSKSSLLMKRVVPGVTNVTEAAVPSVTPSFEEGPPIFTRKRGDGVPELPPGAVLLDKRGIVVRAPVDRDTSLPVLT
jgi:hypothetical protein